MKLTYIDTILAMAPSARPGTAPDPRAQTIQMIGTFVLFGVIFYFLMIRPQQKKAKEHARMLKAVRPGDKILTNGGVLGVVLTVKEKTLTLRSADAKLEITKSAIAEITERSGAASAD